MLRQELQSYFNRVYPYSKIETEHTLGGQVQIRFELGGDLNNGSIERVKQATERAIAIFNDTFHNPDHEIWVLIYERQGKSFFNTSKDYLYQQFSADRFASFYNQLEIVNTRNFTKNNSGNDVLEEAVERIIIGNLSVKDMKAINILNGIANLEMGFDPCIGQSIFFFDPLTDRAFHMYDDRGCYVWSNKADKIRNIYLKRNDWIVDYHRPEIDNYFKQ
jgi:hypothetical protein